MLTLAKASHHHHRKKASKWQKRNPNSATTENDRREALLQYLRRTAPAMYAVLVARVSMAGKRLEELGLEELMEFISQVNPRLARLLTEVA